MAQIERSAAHNFNHLQEQRLSNTSLLKRRSKSYPLSNHKEEGGKRKEAKILVTHKLYSTVHYLKKTREQEKWEKKSKVPLAASKANVHMVRRLVKYPVKPLYLV